MTEIQRLQAQAQQAATLRSELDAAMSQIGQLQAQVSRLQADNDALQSQLSQFQSQNAQLQAALDAANATNSQTTAAMAAAVGSLTSDFRQVFGDPTFQVPGATPLEQLQAIVGAVRGLNPGRKLGVYQNLGGTP